VRARYLVAGLAATRLVRAWKYEEVGERPREKVLGWLERPVLRKQSDEVDVRATAVKEWFHELLDCPHCLGVYLSIGCSLALGNRRTRPIVEGLAAAMILSLIVQWMPGFDFEESYPAVRLRVMGDETAERREP